MRFFVGVEPTPDFRAALFDLQMQLQAAGVDGRYLLPSNLHLTLAFIGEWPEYVKEAMPVITKPFSITISHLGIFSGAKVLWAGIRPSPALNALAVKVRNQLDVADIPYDRQGFNPHITLIRKPILPSEQVLTAIQVAPASMIVQEVCLYQSIHEAGGMKYTVIGRSSKDKNEYAGTR